MLNSLNRGLRRLRCLRHRLVARHAKASARRRVRAAGVDIESLLTLARQSFVQMQAAWDARDLRALEAFTTAPLMADLRAQLQCLPGQAGERRAERTEVVSLRAELLALEELREAFVASVEFSGEIRERCDCHAAPFRELWLLARAKHDEPHPRLTDWRVAGVQSLS